MKIRVRAQMEAQQQAPKKFQPRAHASTVSSHTQKKKQREIEHR